MKEKKNIFKKDPVIGCPFDDSEMKMVKKWRGFSIGDMVMFPSIGFVEPRIKGKIVGIGVNAKYLNGERFTAFAIKVGKTVHYKTHHDIYAV